MADKKITLHPKDSNGQIQDSVNIYPKTTIDQLYSEDGSTAYGDGSFQKPITATNGLVMAGNIISIDSDGATFKNILLNMLYPVNSIYMCTALESGHTECPIKEKLGGTWERIQDKFLYTAGSRHTAGQEGGYVDCTVMSHKHLILENTVTTATTGAHQHTVAPWTHDTSIPDEMLRGYLGSGNQIHLHQNGDVSATKGQIFVRSQITPNTHPEATSFIPDPGIYTNTNGDHSHTVTIPEHYTGDYGPDSTSRPETNFPPFLTVYAWKRTA